MSTPEDLIRNIGNIQLNAMDNLWGRSSLEGRNDDYGGGSAGSMLIDQAISPISNMLLAPFGQQIGGDLGIKQQFDGSQQAMSDLYSLKNQAASNAASHEASKAQAAQRALAEAAQKAKDQGKGTDETMSTGEWDGNPWVKRPQPKLPTDLYNDSTTGDYKTPADASADNKMVEAYIREAATKRGIDPDIAMKVAMSEGGTDVARRGTFNTGSSWWPYQLHYGGKGYEQYGTQAGMGNSFTAATGWQPGDPAAWRASVDYALDRAKQSGWKDWYGASAQGITGMMGIGQAPSNPAPANSGAPYQRNQYSQFGLGLSKAEAYAFCGPTAAMTLASYYGNNIPVEKVREAAMSQSVGWSTAGMTGAQGEARLLELMGMPAATAAWDEAKAQQLIQSGTPIIIDTPGHYFMADQYDPQRGYHVGQNGLDLRGGSEWMTPQQMASFPVAGAPRTIVYRR